LSIVLFCTFHRVTCIPELYEFCALHDTAIGHIEARNDSFGKHIAQGIILGRARLPSNQKMVARSVMVSMMKCAAPNSRRAVGRAGHGSAGQQS
jgi:hypothetical protein